MPEHPHHIRSEAYKYRFDLLFASLLCTIVVNIFFPEDIYDGIAQTCRSSSSRGSPSSISGGRDTS